MKYAKSKRWPDYWILKEFGNLNNEDFIQVCDCLVSNIYADILMLMLNNNTEIKHYNNGMLYMTGESGELKLLGKVHDIEVKY